MKQIFTRLVSVGIASLFCMLSMFGQENEHAAKVVERMVLQQNEVELRATDENTEYWWPDSVVHNNYLGEPTFISFYDKENRTCTYKYMENGKWVVDEPFSSDGFYFFSLKPTYRLLDDGRHIFYADGLWMVGAGPLAKEFIPNTKYDNNGNLILLELSSPPTVFHTYKITYNQKNNPVSVEYYFLNSLWRTRQYEYNANDQCTQIEIAEYNEDRKIMEMTRLETVKYDEKGKPIEGQNLYPNDGERSEHIVFYYSDGTKNDQIAQTAATAYITDRTLYIQSEKAEQITIYSIAGSKLYEAAIQTGMNTINAANFPQGILFIQGSSGWTKKLIAK